MCNLYGLLQFQSTCLREARLGKGLYRVTIAISIHVPT